MHRQQWLPPGLRVLIEEVQADREFDALGLLPRSDYLYGGRSEHRRLPLLSEELARCLLLELGVGRRGYEPDLEPGDGGGRAEAWESFREENGLADSAEQLVLISLKEQSH